MTREVVLDTETTGIEPAEGHRIIEVAAIEVVNMLPTGRHYRTLINPERDIPSDSTRIHGFTNADVEGAPRFAEIIDALLGFIDGAPIVAHNAPFDVMHLNAELARAGRPALAHRVVDTLALAKKRFPGMPNSLDALCRRFEIDLSERTTHNALLDVRLLAQVYLELNGGRQQGLGLGGTGGNGPALATEARRDRTPRPIIIPAEREAAHAAFLDKIKDPIWRR